MEIHSSDIEDSVRLCLKSFHKLIQDKLANENKAKDVGKNNSLGKNENGNKYLKKCSFLLVVREMHRSNNKLSL